MANGSIDRAVPKTIEVTPIGTTVSITRQNSCMLNGIAYICVLVKPSTNISSTINILRLPFLVDGIHDIMAVNDDSTGNNVWIKIDDGGAIIYTNSYATMLANKNYMINCCIRIKQ